MYSDRVELSDDEDEGSSDPDRYHHVYIYLQGFAFKFLYLLSKRYVFHLVVCRNKIST